MGLGIICSGQGNQSLGMFKSLSDNPLIQSQLNYLTKFVGYPLLPQIALKDSELFANHYAQPLIAGLSYLQWQLLKDSLPVPIAFAGYSLGELSSYACAEACDFESLLNLAQKRATVMDNAAELQALSGLLAISGLREDEVLGYCHDFKLYPAIQNSRDMWVVGGYRSNLQLLHDKIGADYPMVKLTWLKVSLASHTPLLQSATQEFFQSLSAQTWHSLAAPVVASVDTQVIYKINDGINSLSQQISATVHFSKTIEIMQELGVSVILELGPGSALSGIVNNLNLPLKIRSFNEFNSLEGIIKWVNKNLDH